MLAPDAPSSAISALKIVISKFIFIHIKYEFFRKSYKLFRLISRLRLFTDCKYSTEDEAIK